MKAVKRVFYVISIMLIAGCAAVVVLALNPSMTQNLSAALYGDSQAKETGGNATGMEEAGVETVPGQEGSLTQLGPSSVEGLSGALAGGGYVVPSGQQISLPQTVEGRSGYEPVKEEKEQVPGEEAEILQSNLQTGDTGAQLNFDTLMYPYYGMLEESMQQVYRQIYANALELNISFAPVVPVNVNQLKNVFEAVYNDHPEIFWLETGYSCKYLQSGQCVEIILQYNSTANHLEEARQRFDAQAQKILSEAQMLSGSSEKEKAVHDALLKLVEYDEGADRSQSAYSALVDEKSVCAGYARAFQYLMQQLQVPCYYCTGFSGQDHAWNIIKLDQGYANVDVTWDDTTPSTYDYYNKSDAELAGTHIRKGLSVYLPACMGGQASGSELGDFEEPSPEGETSGDNDRNGDEQSGEQTYLINPNPLEPITWHSTWNGNSGEGEEEEDKEASAEEKLAEAGITADEVLSTMEDYYGDCLKQMVAAGSGEQQFNNVVPEALWSSIERAYSDKSYEKGYVDKALKELKMDNFAIQLQAQRLGGGYYRLYHTVSTWN